MIHILFEMQETEAQIASATWLRSQSWGVLRTKKEPGAQSPCVPGSLCTSLWSLARWEISKPRLTVTHVNLDRSCYLQMAEGSFQYHRCCHFISWAQICQKTHGRCSFIIIFHNVPLFTKRQGWKIRNGEHLPDWRDGTHRMIKL